MTNAASLSVTSTPSTSPASASPAPASTSAPTSTSTASAVGLATITSLSSATISSSSSSSTSSIRWVPPVYGPTPEYVSGPGGYILKLVAEMPTITLTTSDMIGKYGAIIPIGIDLVKVEIKYRRELTEDEISSVVKETIKLLRGAGVNMAELNSLNVVITAYCATKTFRFP